MTSIKQYLLNQNKDKSNSFRFYIYAYIRTKDSITAKAGTPYYIGKGCGGRAWHEHSSNFKKVNSDIIIILEHNLSNIGACALERRYIEWFGRKILKNGILNNKQEGGEGGEVSNRSNITEVRNCIICNKEYSVVYRFGTKPPVKRTCSRKCGNTRPKKVREKIVREKIVKPSIKIEKTCKCGNIFYVRPSGQNSKYCSVKCCNIYKSFNCDTILKFKNIVTQIEIECTRAKFKEVSGLNGNELNILINNKNKTIKNWTLWDYELNCYKNEIPKPKVFPKSIECEYCNKNISVANYKRWHNEKCKLFTNLI